MQVHCFITMLTHTYASCVIVWQTLYVSSLTVGTGVFSSSLALYKVTTVDNDECLIKLYARCSLTVPCISAIMRSPGMRFVAYCAWMSCERVARGSLLEVQTVVSALRHNVRFQVLHVALESLTHEMRATVAGR